MTFSDESQGDEVLDVPQAAKLLGCGKNKVYALINAGELSCIDLLDRKRRLFRSSVLEFRRKQDKKIVRKRSAYVAKKKGHKS